MALQDSYELRIAQPEHDAAPIADILNHYIERTVIHFGFVTTSVEEVEQKIRASFAEGLPFIVAAESANGKVIGYASASGFRAARKGYAYTAELSVFLAPDCTGGGAGSMLMKKLIEALKRPAEHQDLYGPGVEPRQTRVLLAIMSLDTDRPREGFALRDFYARHGFVQVGQLKKVGYKFDRW